MWVAMCVWNSWNVCLYCSQETAEDSDVCMLNVKLRRLWSTGLRQIFKSAAHVQWWQEWRSLKLVWSEGWWKRPGFLIYQVENPFTWVHIAFVKNRFCLGQQKPRLDCGHYGPGYGTPCLETIARMVPSALSPWSSSAFITWEKVSIHQKCFLPPEGNLGLGEALNLEECPHCGKFEWSDLGTKSHWSRVVGCASKTLSSIFQEAPPQCSSAAGWNQVLSWKSPGKSARQGTQLDVTGTWTVNEREFKTG